MGVIMKIDKSIFNYHRVEFKCIQFGDIFLSDNEFYMKIELNPSILSFVFKCSSKDVHEMTGGCAINLATGWGEVFDDNLMVEPIKAVITREK